MPPYYSPMVAAAYKIIPLPFCMLNQIVRDQVRAMKPLFWIMASSFQSCDSHTPVDLYRDRKPFLFPHAGSSHRFLIDPEKHFFLSSPTCIQFHIDRAALAHSRELGKRIELFVQVAFRHHKFFSFNAWKCSGNLFEEGIIRDAPQQPVCIEVAQINFLLFAGSGNGGRKLPGARGQICDWILRVSDWSAYATSWCLCTPMNSFFLSFRVQRLQPHKLQMHYRSAVPVAERVCLHGYDETEPVDFKPFIVLASAM